MRRRKATGGPTDGKYSLVNLMVSICLILSIFQIFIANYQVINLSLFWLVSLIVLPLALPPQAFAHRLIQFTSALILIQLISLLWSPSPLLGISDTLKLLAFLVVLGLGLRHGSADWDGLITVLRIYCLIALVQSVLVIALRVDTRFGYHLTDFLLRSDWSSLFFEKNILVVFFGFGGDPEHDINSMGINTVGGIYNVYSTGKSGGLELNGNIAGAWGGILTFLSLGVFDRNRPVVSSLMVIIHALSIVFCGSKGSLFLLGLMPFLLFIIRFGPWVAGKLTIPQLISGIVLLGAGIAYIFFREPLTHLLSTHNKYIRESTESAEIRRDLWQQAVREFKTTPLFGHGFGGWARAYDHLPAINDQIAYFRLPPHNSLVLLWSQSGIAALIAGLGIIGLSLRSFVQLLKGPHGGFALAGLGAFLFWFLQSLFENINPFTNLHQSAPLALVIGMCAAQGKARSATLSSGMRRDDSAYSRI